MADCELIDECPYFSKQLVNKDDKRKELKEKYCRTNYLHCARYMIVTAVGKEAVPSDLAPDQKTKAYEIISSIS